MSEEKQKDGEKMKVGKPIRALLSFILAFAMIVPTASKNVFAATYPKDSSGIVLDADITGDSQNDHTYAKAFWTNGDTVYLMAESTHFLKEVSLLNGSGGKITSTTFDRYPPGESITVDGKTYKHDESQGNTKDAHLTVFKFSLSSILSQIGLNESGIYGIEVISEQGQGHWIYGSLIIKIPKAKAVVRKILSRCSSTESILTEQETQR